MATAVFADMAILQSDTVLQGRIAAAMFVFCTTTISGETNNNHQARHNFAAQILNNPNFYKPFFQAVVCCNQIVANDATAGGTLVGMTTTQIGTAAAAVLDADISNAIAAAFNSFVQGV